MSNKSGSAVGESAVPSSRARRFDEAFKRDAVRLVTDEKYSFQAAATAVGASQQSLRDWHTKFAPQPVAYDQHASQDELRDEIKRLRQQLKRAEMERDILKRATAYFAQDLL